MGFGSITLFLLFAMLTGIASAWPRRFVPLWGSMGLLLGAYLVASIAFGWTYPYTTYNISIYLVFFAVVILIASAVCGSLIALAVSRLSNEWSFHAISNDNAIYEYRSGLRVGQWVTLKKDLVVVDHDGTPNGNVYKTGEVWQVLAGVASDPVVRFRQADGEVHTWDDDFDSIEEWFQVVGDASK
jgi:hypothetical protein